MSPDAQHLPTGSDLAALWPDETPADVRAFLDNHPSRRGDKDAVLDLAYDEYCRLVEDGSAPDPNAFCARFPTYQSSLRRAIQAHDYLAAHPDLLEERDRVPWPIEGETFLGFRLLRELGRGAFARVYLAAEPELGDRLVAVKVSPHGGGEAQTLGRLDHPNVVKVHAVRKDEHSGLTAVCMPYLGGATLGGVLTAFAAGRPQQASVILDAARAALGPEVPGGEWLAPHPLLQNAPYVEGVALVGAQLAEALAFLHARGIYHRDLKPSNVLLCPDGRPMLLDFNLSADPRGGRERLGGTLPYMAPEQVLSTFGPAVADSLRESGGTRGASAPPYRAAAPVDGRSDLFALGVILFELLTGRLPFGPVPRGQPSPLECELLLMRQQKGAPPVRSLCPEASPALARVVAECLAFDREQRPASAAAVAVALRRDLAPWRRLVRRLRRHPRQLAAAAALTLVLIAGGATYLAVRPTYAERMLEEARVAYAAGDNRKALDRAGLVLAQTPDSAEAHFLRGRVYQRQGELELARDDYSEANRLAPSGRAAACFAYCLNRGGAYPQAIARSEEALAAGFRTAEVYNNLAYAQMRHGQMPAAEANLALALELAPGLPAALHNRLVPVSHKLSLKQRDRLPQARTVLDAALAHCPESAELRGDAATLCALAGSLQPDGGWDEDALTHLEAGSRLGLAVKDLPANPLYRRLWAEPRFVALCQAAPTTAPSPSTGRLADPLGESAP